MTGPARFHLPSFIATCGGIGKIRPGPGTWGSLIALLPAWGIGLQWGGIGLLLAALVAYGIGIWAAEGHEQNSGSHDSSEVVIDEVAGQWLAIALACFFAPISWTMLGIAFVLFRLFDIWKPLIIGTVDRKMHGGAGTMTDDMLAGLAAGLLTGAALTYLPEF